MSDLTDRVIDYSHRSDLSSKAQGFVDVATERLRMRFGGVLPDQTLHENLYFYAAMRELRVYTEDYEQAVKMDELLDKEASRLNIKYEGTDWDNPTKKVLNELEIAIAQEQA